MKYTTFLLNAAMGACMLASAPQVSAQTPALADLPAGSVSIHYVRSAGDYDGWGLHVWESFEKTDGKAVTGPKAKSDVPLEGVTWTAPMKPSGKDGFGVYWQVKASEFRNKKANIIIHKGDVKEHCGKDVSWFPEDKGMRVFFKQGDCNIYFNVGDVPK